MTRQCALCGSQHRITFHHLIPKCCHKNKWFRKRFELTDMRERGVDICRPCHSFIHKQFPPKFLGRELNTLDKILGQEKVQKHILWAQKRRMC